MAGSEALEEELRTLDFKLGQLRRDYDQYFLGTRPREPVQLRAEVNKTVIRLSSTAIQNTAQRFKFSSLCSRFQACRRQWDENLRKIEAGTYERHRFRARVHGDADDAGSDDRGGDSRAAGADDLYRSYVDARLACGESVDGFTREKLARVLAKQRKQLASRYGAGAEFTFRVEVDGGRTVLKATRQARRSRAR